MPEYRQHQNYSYKEIKLENIEKALKDINDTLKELVRLIKHKK